MIYDVRTSPTRGRCSFVAVSAVLSRVRRYCLRRADEYVLRNCEMCRIASGARRVMNERRSSISARSKRKAPSIRLRRGSISASGEISTSGEHFPTNISNVNTRTTAESELVGVCTPFSMFDAPACLDSAGNFARLAGGDPARCGLPGDRYAPAGGGGTRAFFPSLSSSSCGRTVYLHVPRLDARALRNTLSIIE